MELLRKIHRNGDIQNDTEFLHDVYQLKSGRFPVVDTFLEGNVLALDAAVNCVGTSGFGADSSIRKDFLPLLVRILFVFFLCAAHRRNHPVVEGFNRISFWGRSHLAHQLEIYIDNVPFVELW